jgi:Holliday junction resolvase RusA-like endonuclease
VVYHLHRLDRDVDGSHKAVVDGFKGVLWRDDKQVVLLAARKALVPRDVFPYVSVVVRELAHIPSYRPQGAPGGAVAFETNIWPPTTNNAYALSGGRRRKTAAARSASEAYAFGVSRLVRHPPAIDGPARLRIRYGITADRRDVEGSHKLLVDAMRGVAWRDDSQVMSFSVSKARLPKGAQPVIDVVTWAIPGARQGRP